MLKIFLFVSLMFCSVFAEVDGHLDIVKKGMVLPKIVVTIATDSLEKGTLSKIKKSLSDDLGISGHFDVATSTTQFSYNGMPDLSLRNQGISLVINLSAEREAGGNYTLKTKLYDLNAVNALSGNTSGLVLEKNFTTSLEERFVFLAHKSAITINDYFKAPSIAWMDKFVVFAVYDGPRKSDIMIGDYSLTYKKKVVTGGLNIFPKWADKEQKTIYYTSYNYDKPTLVKLNIYNRSKEVIMDSDGMLACSDVSKDGSKLLVTASPTGQPDIFLYDVNARTKKQVAGGPGWIDVGGQFVEDDKEIVFVSDRLGNPNIFKQRIGSSSVERMVFHSKNNSSVTSNGNNIIFSSKDSDNEMGKSFNLYLISTRTDSLQRLTTQGVNQFPKFSPDGQSVLFIKTVGDASAVGIIRLEYNKSFLFPLTGKRIQSIDW